MAVSINSPFLPRLERELMMAFSNDLNTVIQFTDVHNVMRKKKHKGPTRTHCG